MVKPQTMADSKGLDFARNLKQQLLGWRGDKIDSPC